MSRNKEVTSLVGEIKKTVDEYVQIMFRNKNVSGLPALPIELKFAEGWRSELLYANDVRDCWLVKGEKGTRLPEHFHEHQNEILTVVQGEIVVLIKDKTTVLKVGESFEITKGKPHEIVVNDKVDAELIVIYQPPLAIKAY